MIPQNPVVGGTVLRRAAIKSPNFLTGVSGWTINQDGSAEFNNGTFRGVVTDSGLFVYNGVGAPGNPPLFSITKPGQTSDPFGNPVNPAALTVGSAGLSQIEMVANSNQAFDLTTAIGGFLQAVAELITTDTNELLPGILGGLILGSGATAKMATALLSPLGTTGNQGTGIALQAMNDGGTDTGLITLGTYSTPDNGTTVVFTPILALAPYALILYSGASGTTVVTKTSGSGTIPIPVGVTTAKAECWGSGGGGGSASGGTGAGGGGGGEYAAEPSLAVTGGGTVAYSVGAAGSAGTGGNTGGTGNNSTLTGSAVTVTANGGQGGNTGGAGAAPGGTGSTNTTHFNGGAGAITGSATGGAGGGSSAGTSAAGNAGSSPIGGTGGAGGTAPTGGGAGGRGGNSASTGSAGAAPGGGGGASGGGSTPNGGAGAHGQVRLTYSSGPPAILFSVATAGGGTDEFGTAYNAGVHFTANQQTELAGPLKLDNIATPATPVNGPKAYGSSGQLDYASTDGNFYDTGRLTLIAAGQTISSTTPATITGLSAPVVAGSYRLHVVLSGLQGGGAFPVVTQVTGPAASAVLGFTTMVVEGAGVTDNVKHHNTLPSSFTGPAFGAGAQFMVTMDLYLTFTAAGTLAVQAAQGSAGHNWQVDANSFLDLMPVT